MKYLFSLLVLVFPFLLFADPSYQQIATATCKISSSDMHYKESDYPLYDMVDNNLNTAWVYTTDSTSIYDYNRNKVLWIDSNTKIYSIALINGYAKTHDLYYQNDRINEVIIKTTHDTCAYKLVDTIGYQIIMLRDPSRIFTLSIENTVQGPKYNDICITEIKLLDKNGLSIIDQDKYCIYSSAGEYPYYTLFENNGKILYAPQTDGISYAGFSPKINYAYFCYDELSSEGGIDFINLSSGKLIQHFKNWKPESIYPDLSKWVDDNNAIVTWFDSHRNKYKRKINLLK